MQVVDQVRIRQRQVAFVDGQDASKNQRAENRRREETADARYAKTSRAITKRREAREKTGWIKKLLGTSSGLLSMAQDWMGIFLSANPYTAAFIATAKAVGFGIANGVVMGGKVAESANNGLEQEARRMETGADLDGLAITRREALARNSQQTAEAIREETAQLERLGRELAALRKQLQEEIGR